MPQIGPMEILVVAVIALIVFGPEKLPHMARSVGKAVGDMRRMASEMRNEFDVGLHDAEEFDEPEPPEPAKPKRVNPDSEED